MVASDIETDVRGTNAVLDRVAVSHDAGARVRCTSGQLGWVDMQFINNNEAATLQWG